MSDLDYCIIFAMGFSAAVTLTLGLYLIFSHHTIFTCDITPSRKIRRATGYLLLIFSSMFILAAFGKPIYFGEIESKVISNLGILTNLIFLIPSILNWLFAFIQEKEKYQRIILPPLLIPAVLFFLYIFLKKDLFLFTSHIFWAIYIIVFGIYFFLRLRKYRKELNDNFADLTNRDFRQLKITAAIAASIAIVYGYLIIAPNGCKLMILLLYALDITLAVNLTYIADHQAIIPEISSEDIEEITEVPEDSNSTKSSKQKRKTNGSTDKLIGKKLKEICEKGGLFLSPDIDAFSLARAIGTNRTYISRYLNSHGTNFNKYINSLRIKYAVKLINSSKGRPNLSEIAERCGYKQLNSFRTAFKSHTGILPSEYINKKFENVHP